MTNSDNSRGDRQGLPGNPPHQPQYPSWPQPPQYQPGAPQGHPYPQPQHPGYQQPLPAGYGYEPQTAAPSVYPQGYPGEFVAGQPQSFPPQAQGGYAPYAQPPSAEAAPPVGYHPGGEFAAPAQQSMDDYYYPRGQNILPDVPPAVLPPELSAGAGLGAGVPPVPPAAGQTQNYADYAQPAAYAGGDYAAAAPDHRAVEQISHRLAQLQSQYDREMAANWQEPQPQASPQPGYDPHLYAAPDTMHAYAAHQAPQPPMPAYQDYPYQQQPPMRAEPAAYQGSYPQEHYSSANAYPSPQAGQMPQPGYGGYPQPAPQAGAGLAQEGDAPFAAGTLAAPPVAPTGSKRKLLMAAAFAGALAVGGGAAVTHKYADIFGGSETSAPVVRASETPVKEMKSDSGNDAVRSASAAADGMSGGSGRNQAPSMASAAADTVAAATTDPMSTVDTPADTGESGPRRVKTLVVRPDGTIVQPDASEEAQPAPPPVKEVAAKSPQPAADSPRPATRVVSPASARQAPTAATETKPVAPAAKPVEKAERKVVAATAENASEPAAGEIGSPFVVQVTARNTPSDALAAFADLQQKYPSLIGAYEPDIERADLGEKGVWYRLRVGPVVGKTAAADLCTRLKAAGHRDCFVRRK